MFLEALKALFMLSPPPGMPLLVLSKVFCLQDFPGGLVVKSCPLNTGHMGLIPALGTKLPYAEGYSA